MRKTRTIYPALLWSQNFHAALNYRQVCNPPDIGRLGSSLATTAESILVNEICESLLFGQGRTTLAKGLGRNMQVNICSTCEQGCPTCSNTVQLEGVSQDIAMLVKTISSVVVRSNGLHWCIDLCGMFDRVKPPIYS